MLTVNFNENGLVDNITYVNKENKVDCRCELIYTEGLLSILNVTNEGERSVFIFTYKDGIIDAVYDQSMVKLRDYTIEDGKVTLYKDNYGDQVIHHNYEDHVVKATLDDGTLCYQIDDRSPQFFVTPQNFVQIVAKDKNNNIVNIIQVPYNDKE